MKDTALASSASIPAFDLSASRSDVLGATPDDTGTNFALYSGAAERVELCLFDDSGVTQTHSVDLPLMEGGIWHGYLPDVKAGQAYGYRVHGPFDPQNGHRFNPAKLLLDPYAKSMRGYLKWDDALYGYPVGGSDLEIDTRDSAAFMPKAVVTSSVYDWDADDILRHDWSDTLIYEAHVKGLTQLHPKVVKADRGTFAGLASDPVIEHLHRIGVTAIELLPIHTMVQDHYLVEKNLSNYWGYNTLGFFAPNRGYLASEDIREVKAAIKRFHAAGIEVILDVVYNHTAEGNELGPTLSFKGIDNAAYYLHGDDKRHCYDTTGCGNTLNVAHPMVLRMVMDSLRYWVEVMHVDGFRFDLASTLGREPTGFDREGAFFNAIRQDPVLAGIKLIAEPWDIGDGGYQVGGFPWPFREWNDKARDDMRAFWRRKDAQVPRVSQRLLGSPTQFNHDHRPATSSVNFLAAHDGFTLWDTVSYNDKHNDANGEDNRDGHDHNLSDNMGVEGPTQDAGVNGSRERRVKAMLATLMMSHGVPMILAGDEMGKSQNGNNNAYCQDNALTWLDWDGARPALTDAFAALSAFRRDHKALLAPRFFAQSADDAEDKPDRLGTRWFHPQGREMTPQDWQDAGLSCFAVEHDAERDASGAAVEEDILIILNAGDEGPFVLPPCEAGLKWVLHLDTSRADVACAETIDTGTLDLPWQSVLVLTRETV
ncbi:Glycogen debranching enzyme [Aquimixticola soesokkakensis]|uniref:Glycogen debranching enzyme n=1 Tax=Aquimixticola soesokkakensis TaxID=1519096 RepID=A0A1Y5SZV6_9RHOB|nr:glycogen debranching protein GlgX [Aquimixticola soesokkakensis]SLN50393.1 Glycogen debranching enzyme [Aquimixticola soesokkakensis]